MIVCYTDEGFKGLTVKNPVGEKLFSNKKHTRINPNVCRNCGFVEWYAEEPERLL
jgi:predicted Zn-ribbon and HTH transcriptional regulator